MRLLLCILFVAVFLFATINGDTVIMFKNYCTTQKYVTEQTRTQASTNVCFLATGENCNRTVSCGEISYKFGFTGQTRTEFQMRNPDHFDHFRINVAYGFDLPVGIVSHSGGISIRCDSYLCPDGNRVLGNYDNKVYRSPVDGLFEVRLCPPQIGK